MGDEMGSDLAFVFSTWREANGWEWMRWTVKVLLALLLLLTLLLVVMR